MATRSNSEEQKRTYSPPQEYDLPQGHRLIRLISTDTPQGEYAGSHFHSGSRSRNSKSVDEARQVFIEKYAPTVQDDDIEEVEASLRALNTKLYTLSSTLTQKNTHFEETLKASRQYVVEEKGVAFKNAAAGSPERKYPTDTTHYSKLKRYINDISANTNSYTFKQALKVVRERIEFCEKLTVEIEEKYRKGGQLELRLQQRLTSLEELLNEEKLKNEYADNLFKQLHQQYGSRQSELPSFILKKADEGVQAQTTLTSGGPSLTSLIATGEEAAEQAKTGAANLKYESELQLRSLEERDASIRERETEFSLLQTRFLNKVQKKKRELEHFASDLKHKRKQIEEKEQHLKEEEQTLQKLSQNLKKQERFLKKKQNDVEEAQMQIDMLEQNISEKQLIINKQIENIQMRERNLANESLEKSFELQQKEEVLQKRETEVLEREQLSTDMQLRENIIETKLQTISENEFNLLKQQSSVKTRLKELEQRETQLEKKKEKFGLKLEQLTDAFVELQKQRTLVLEREDGLKLREAVLRDKQLKFEQFKRQSISQIKESSMDQLSEKDMLLKKKSRLEVMEKKLHFTEQLLAQDQSNINVNKREAELRNKEIDLLQKELELEMQQQELASKIDEVNNLVNELAQWSGMPPPLQEFQIDYDLNPSSSHDLKLTPNPSYKLAGASPSSQTEGGKMFGISVSSSPLEPLKSAVKKQTTSMYLMAADNLQISLEQKSFYSGMVGSKSGASSQLGTSDVNMTPVSRKVGGTMLDIDESVVEGEERTDQSMEGIKEILSEMKD